MWRLKLFKALLFKLLIHAVLFGVLLPWVFGFGTGATALAVLALWLGSFLIGDALVLPAAGSAVAAVADFGFVALALAVMLGRLGAGVLAVAAAAGLAELAFHRYLLREVPLVGGNRV